MDRRYLSPVELVSAATHHALCADYLLRYISLGEVQRAEGIDVLSPVVSLMYQAFQLLFKAYYLHEHRPIKEYKSLVALMEMNNHLGLSSKEIALLKTLSRQNSIHKGADYDLWEDQQQLHVFCENILYLYERVQRLMPLELHPDYHL
jgi:hypothetical protein